MIPYGHQDIDDSDIESVGKALRGEFLTTGPLVEKFEKELENFTGAATTVVSSGTAALHCAYKAIDIQAGDEVITQALTFIATINSIIYNNADPIFLDVDIDTMGLSPKAVNNFLEEKLKIFNILVLLNMILEK
jgi:dTDP-4-amino-4,6-dideoxygalactose transaminase